MEVPAVNNKVVVTNKSALQSKYGTRWADIDAALQRLIAADNARAIATTIVAIDDKATMAAFRAAAVSASSDEVGTKNAINAVLGTKNPDYLMILGGPDVVCHQTLDNPMQGDGDLNVPSDLPYASTSSYGPQISQHIGATHVVGRLPDLPNSTNPDFLVSLIDGAAAAQTRGRVDYQNCFGLSAQVWQASTQMSLAAIFGGTPAVYVAPPTTPPVAAGSLQPRSHFINCHGAQADFRFYGQQGNSYPVAMETPDVVGKISDGSVVAAECCYGAEIYDPTLAGNMGLCCAYLSQGAYGFFGSTTIAYGPATSNANADLVAQYFLQDLIAGGVSLGHACIDARHRFVQTTGPVLGNADLKTLGQFLLLGDPSVHPVAKPSSDSHTAAEKAFGLKDEVRAAARELDRNALQAKGAALYRTVVYPKAAARKGPLAEAIRVRLRDFAAQRGLPDPEISSYDIEGDTGVLETTKAFGQLPTIHLMIQRLPTQGRVMPVRALIVYESGARLVLRQDLWSR